MANLSTKLNTTTTTNQLLLARWGVVIKTLADNHVVRIATITGTTAEKYRLDFAGLLKELAVPDEYIYPHIRVNGFNSSDQYSGDLLNIKILDAGALSVYYETFVK